MDKKNKIITGAFILLFVGSIGTAYWRIVVKKYYTIESQVDCDPTVDKCFVWKCDPAAIDESEKCTGDAESDVWYYAVTRRTAANIPLCDSKRDENCDPWTCPEGEKKCGKIFCDEKTKKEQEVNEECVDPVQYALDNPIVEEEVVECEEGNEEC